MASLTQEILAQRDEALQAQQRVSALEYQIAKAVQELAYAEVGLLLLPLGILEDTIPRFSLSTSLQPLGVGGEGKYDASLAIMRYVFQGSIASVFMFKPRWRPTH